MEIFTAFYFSVLLKFVNVFVMISLSLIIFFVKTHNVTIIEPKLRILEENCTIFCASPSPALSEWTDAGHDKTDNNANNSQVFN